MINSDLMSKFILQGVAYKKEVKDCIIGSGRLSHAVSFDVC